MDDSEHDVLAYITFPAQHRTKLHSTNPLERLNKEVKRRADVVGIFPNEASITRLIGAVLLEQNDEWLLQCRYMQIEGMAELTSPLTRRRSGQTSTHGRLTNGHLKLHPDLHHLDGRDPLRAPTATPWHSGGPNCNRPRSPARATPRRSVSRSAAHASACAR